ncbi:MAG: hypothetical protein LW731_12235, partial [Oxalobacteraceae bacterium]|nr:hypothetical protein [Oxalobacteraceae bacterium]
PFCHPTLGIDLLRLTAKQQRHNPTTPQPHNAAGSTDVRQSGANVESGLTRSVGHPWHCQEMQALKQHLSRLLRRNKRQFKIYRLGFHASNQ